jgi:hypothetical protein
VDQAAALTGILGDGTLDRAVVIDVPLEVARARLLARRMCADCGRIYSVRAGSRRGCAVRAVGRYAGAPTTPRRR